MNDDQDRIEIFKELFPHPSEGAFPLADGLLAGMLVDPRLPSRVPSQSALGITTRPVEGGKRPFLGHEEFHWLRAILAPGASSDGANPQILEASIPPSLPLPEVGESGGPS